MPHKDKKAEGAALITLDVIERKIFVIRQQKVMLDSDLATLYGIETRVFELSRETKCCAIPRRFHVSNNG